MAYRILHRLLLLPLLLGGLGACARASTATAPLVIRQPTAVSTAALIPPTAPPTWPTAIPTPAAAATATACSQVARIAPDSAEAQVIGAPILAYLAKHESLKEYVPFQFQDIRSLDRVGDWIVMQASFSHAAEPAIFVIRATSTGYELGGVGWSGQATSAMEIRAWLTRQFPEAPPQLSACLEPVEWFVS